MERAGLVGWWRKEKRMGDKLKALMDGVDEANEALADAEFQRNHGSAHVRKVAI